MTQLKAALLALLLFGGLFGQTVSINFVQAVSVRTDTVVPNGFFSFLMGDTQRHRVYITDGKAEIQILNLDDLSQNAIPLPYAPAGACISKATGQVATMEMLFSLSARDVVHLSITDPATGQQKTSELSSTPASPFDHCDFSQDGQTLYLSSSLKPNSQIKPTPYQLATVDVASGAVISSERIGAPVVGLGACPNGEVYFVTANSSSGKISSFSGNGGAAALAFSPIFGYTGGSFDPSNPSGSNFYVNGRTADGQSSSVVLNCGTGSLNPTVNFSKGIGTLFPGSFPTGDPWFMYTVRPNTDVFGINIFQDTVMSHASDPRENYGIFARRLSDGTDQVMVLRDNELDFYTAVQPPSAYSCVNAADFVPAALSAGEIVSCFGYKLTDQSGLPASSIPLPTQLGGTQVLFNGNAAPLYYVSPGQINVQVPTNVGTTGTVNIQVVSALGSSNSISATLAASDPGVFSSPNGNVATSGNSWTSLPSMVNEETVIYATGLGATAPTIPEGTASPSSPVAEVTTIPVVTLCGQQAQVMFAGLTPTLVALYQINVVVPAACANADPSVPDSSRVTVTAGQ